MKPKTAFPFLAGRARSVYGPAAFPSVYIRIYQGPDCDQQPGPRFLSISVISGQVLLPSRPDSCCPLCAGGRYPRIVRLWDDYSCPPFCWWQVPPIGQQPQLLPQLDLPAFLSRTIDRTAKNTIRMRSNMTTNVPKFIKRFSSPPRMFFAGKQASCIPGNRPVTVVFLHAGFPRVDRHTVPPQYEV